MKKTLLITLDFYPAVGGVASVWRFLSQYLPSKRWFVLAPKNKSNNELTADYKIYRANLSSPHWLVMFFQILKIIKKEKIELLVAGQILPVGTVCWLLKKFFKIPYIVSTHGMDVLLPLKNERKKRLCKKILDGCEKVITISQFTADHLQLLGASKEKIFFVRDCPTKEDLLPEVEKQLVVDFKKYNEIAKNKKIIVTLGRLVARKGHDYMIKALKKVEYENWVYYIIGGGENEKNLKKLVKDLDLDDKVFFLGALNDNEATYWLKRSDIFAMTPVNLNGDVEGFGIVYLDANNFSKPVIAFDSGGVSDAVVDNETGLLIKEGDIKGLIGAIEKLLSDDKLAKRLGDGGKSRIDREFNWATQADILNKILS